MAGAETAAEAGVVKVPHGRPVAEAVRDVIRRVKVADPMAPVTVAVHSSWAGLSLRRLLASGELGPVAGGRPGLVNVSFVTIARIAELLGAPALAAAGRRPLSAPVRTEAVRTALLASPGLFAHAARHPSTVIALDRALEELRRCPDDLVDRLAARSRRAAEVVRICREAQARMADWYDEVDLARSATDALRAGSPPPPALVELGHVVTAALEPLPPAFAQLVAAFSARQASSGAATVVETADSPEVPAGAANHVLTCSDPDEEVRNVVRQMAESIEAGTPLHRLAVLYPHDSYARLIHQQLDAAGMPFNGPAVRRLADTPAGAALTGLLHLMETDLPRNEVIDWLAAAPILTADNEIVPSTAWDRVSRRAGVIRGHDQWSERLAALAAREEERARDLEAEDPGASGSNEWRAAAARREAPRAAELAAFVAELHERITTLLPDPGAPWRRWAAWACETLERYLGSPARHQWWPDEEQDFYVAVREALEGLAALDEVGPGCDSTAFRSAVARALEAAAGRVGRFGDGVMVGPLRHGRGLDLDAVWVVGMSEGLAPVAGGGSSVLLEEDRQAAVGDTDGPSPLDTRRTRQDRQAVALQAALASAGGSARRTLSWSRAELRSARPRLPSRWLLGAASELAGERVALEDLARLAGQGHPAFTEILSFASGLDRVGAGRTVPASLHDRDVAQLSDWNRRAGRLEDHPVAYEGPAAAFAHSAADRSRPFGPFSGKVDPARLVLRRRHSATKLESYAACPFRWFLAEGLGLSSEEAPEELIQISSRDKGSLVHEILERYIIGVLAGEPREFAFAKRVADGVFHEWNERGLTGKALLWDFDRRVILGELERFVREDRLQPLAAELSFGRGPDDYPPVEVEVGGESISFSGQADRVDEEGAGLVVTDYKTGKVDEFSALEDDPVMAGTKLQLHIYARAARAAFGQPDTPVRARYWFVSERGDFKERAVDLDRDAERFNEALSVITASIKAGLFPARPGDDSYWGYKNCSRCDFDRLCRVDREREWQAVSTDVELKRYVALSDPPEPE